MRLLWEGLRLGVASLWSHKLIGDELLTVADSTPYGGPRRVYLPAGRWVNFHTGEWLASEGQWFDGQPTVIDGVTRLPLYARAGAILPLMHVDEQTMNLDGRRRDVGFFVGRGIETV